MNDLLSELNNIDGASSSNKQDRPSSPLRPNPKYCSLVHPEPIRPASSNYKWTTEKRLQRSDEKFTPSAPRYPAREPPNGISALIRATGGEPARSAVSSSRSDIPETVQRILAVTGGGMEVDEDAQTDTSSSPIKPNEKYCKIVTPSRSRVASLPAVQPTPARPVQHGRNHGAAWRPDDDELYGRRSTSPYPSTSYGTSNPATYRTPAPPHASYRTPDLPHPSYRNPDPSSYRTPYPPRHPPSYRTPDSSSHRTPVQSHHISSSDSAEPMDRSPSPASHYSNPSRSMNFSSYSIPSSHDASTTPSSSSARDKAQEEWNIVRQLKELERQNQARESRMELDRRKKKEAEKVARLKEDDNRRRQKAMEEERRRHRLEEDRRYAALKEQRRLRYAAENQARLEAEDEARRYEEEVYRTVQERSRDETRARAQLKSFADAPRQPRHPQREVKEEGVVRLTKEELDALKSQCKAEGERKAREEARREEAQARLERCMQRIGEQRRDEPEPMEVEESDTVESSVPASNSNTSLAPIRIKAKPEPSEEDVDPYIAIKVEEIPLPPGPPGDGVRQKRRGEGGKSRWKKAFDEDEDEDLVIIEKPPVEVIDIFSDDEDTVATTTVSSKKEIKQEPASQQELDDDIWIVKSKNGKKGKPKVHVFDPSKVKKEKQEEEEPRVSDASESTPSIRFDAARVKAEPVEKAGPSRRKEDAVPQSKLEPVEEAGPSRRKESMENTVPQSSRVKTEPVDTVAPTVACPPRPPSVPLPDYEDLVEEEGEAATAPGMDVVEATAAARRLIRQIDETVQSAQQQQLLLQQPRPRRPRRVPRVVHVPTAGSFLHGLRIDRKRRTRCDADDDEEEVRRKRIRCNGTFEIYSARRAREETDK